MDDSYYWPLMDTIVPNEPVYDRNAREFIFLEDTVQRPDTVRMRIIEKWNAFCSYYSLSIYMPLISFKFTPGELL